MANETSDDGKDVCIIYAEDTEQWAEHFKGEFEISNTTSGIMNVQTVLPFCQDKQQDKWLKDAKVVVVILSEQMIDFLIKHRGANFSSCVTELRKGVLFKLSVVETDIAGNEIPDQFPDYYNDQWTKLEYGENSTVEDLQTSIRSILNLVEKNSALDDPVGDSAINYTEQEKQSGQKLQMDNVPRAPHETYLCMDQVRRNVPPQEEYLKMGDLRKLHPKPKPRGQSINKDTYDGTALECDKDAYDTHMYPESLPPTDSYEISMHDDDLCYEITEFKERKVAKKQIKVEAVPSDIQCESDTEVCLCFAEEVKGYEEGKMEIEIQKAEDPTDSLTVKKVEKLNPYTFKFKSAGTEGLLSEMKAKIVIFLNNEKVGSCNVQFTSSTDRCDGINHILLQLLDITCNTVKEQNADILPKVDNKFKRKFMSSDTEIEPSAFENLFGMYTYTSNENSKLEIPTILHLAAKYGFNELSAKLIDLPRADLANSITTSQKKMPSCIAKENNHLELSNMLDSFIEISQADYELYVKMVWNDPYLLPKNMRPTPYYNKSAEHQGHDRALYYSDSTKTTSSYPRSPVSPTQLVYDDPDRPAGEPSEDYMDMNGIKRKLNLKPQPSSISDKPKPMPFKKNKAFGPGQPGFFDADNDDDDYTTPDPAMSNKFLFLKGGYSYAFKTHNFEMPNDEFWSCKLDVGMHSKTLPPRNSQAKHWLGNPNRGHSLKLKGLDNKRDGMRRSKSEDSNMDGARTEFDPTALEVVHDTPFEGYQTQSVDVQENLNVPNPFHIKSVKTSAKSPVLSPAQEELCSIQKKVAGGELSIDDARMLYHEWQRKQPRDDSFKGKQQRFRMLKEVKRDNLYQQQPLTLPKPSGKPGGGIFSKFTSKSKDGPIGRSANTRAYVRPDVQMPKQVICPETQLVYDDVLEEGPSVPKNRLSQDSNGSSRDSRGSIADSGNGSEREPDEGHPPKVPMRKYSTSDTGGRYNARKSRSEIYNEKASNMPQIPPKLPLKGLHLSPRPNKPPMMSPPTTTAPKPGLRQTGQKWR